MKNLLKHILIGCCSVIALFAINISFAQNSGFSDVNLTHQNKAAIDYFQSQELFTGYPDGTFQPDRILNRAEQLKVYMLLSSHNPDAVQYNSCFPDVHDEWFARFVCFAKELGVVEGYPDGTFRPAQEVNKAEALKMLGELQSWPLPNPTSAPYDDVPANEWFAPYVYYAMDQNLLEESGRIYGPGEGISRAGTAELMFRSLAPQLLQQRFTQELLPELLTTDIISDEEELSTTPQPSFVIENITPESGTVQAGSFYDVAFTMLGADGKPVENGEIDVYFQRNYKVITGDEQEGLFNLHHTGNGNYEVQVTSRVSGVNLLVIRDNISRTIHTKEIEFTPASPTQLIATNEEGPGGSYGFLGSKKYTLVLADQYNNLVKGGTVTGTTTFGELTIEEKYNGTIEAVVTADGYGTTNVQFNAEYNGKTYIYNDTIDFLPIGSTGTPGYEVNDEITRIPINLFVPNVGQQVSSFDYSIEIPNTLDVVGLNMKGAFLEAEIEELEVDGKRVFNIHMYGPLENSTFDEKIGDIVIEGVPEGHHELAGSIFLASDNQEFPETLQREGGLAEADEGGIYVTPYPRPFIAIQGKTEKRICMDVFVSPHEGVTREQVESDIRQAEDIFYHNAEECNCPHYLKIDYAMITFSEEDWDLIEGDNDYFGTGDVIDFYNRNTPVTPRPWCTKVFYASNDGDTEGGVSTRNEETDAYDGVGNFIRMNNSRDIDGRTLAHELTHHLSGNMVVDPDDAEGPEQGAGRQDNLMSYDETSGGRITHKNTGDNLTQEQCDLISWDHRRFSHYPGGQ